MARAYKWVRLASAEWVVQSGQGEGPMFISPVQSGAKGCDSCHVTYKPIAYQLGQVEAHHWHPGTGASGIYHFNMTDQRPYVDLATSKSDLTADNSLKYETSWLLDMECSEDCTGHMLDSRQDQYGRLLHKKDNPIVQSSSVTVKAVYPLCFHCHEEVLIGRMVEGLERQRTTGHTELEAVCELCIARYRCEPYWIMFNAIDGQPWFMPVVDKAEAPSAMSGMVQVGIDGHQELDLDGYDDLKRRGYLPPDWQPGKQLTRFQAKQLGEFRDWDDTVRGDFYRTVELQQKKSKVIHDVTMKQMQLAQGHRRDEREWAERMKDVEEKLAAAMRGDV